MLSNYIFKLKILLLHHYLGTNLNTTTHQRHNQIKCFLVALINQSNLAFAASTVIL